MNSVLNIGSQLVSNRRAAGMSQRELAERLGTTQQQIARWEGTAYRTAALERVAAAADVLGVGTDVPLAAEASASYAPSPAAAAAPARDLGDVVARVRALDAQLRGYGVASVTVFGSFATGEQTPDSDVDLLVEIGDRDKVRGFRFVELARILEDALGRPVDVAQPHLIRERLKARVAREAIVVWPS